MKNLCECGHDKDEHNAGSNEKSCGIQWFHIDDWEQCPCTKFHPKKNRKGK